MKALTTFSALALMAMPAFAGDGYGPTVTPGLDWSGLYIGVHGGYAQDKFDPSTPLIPNEGDLGKDGKKLLGETDGNGWLGGAQIGINQQYGRWVVGLEADISGGDLNADNSLSQTESFDFCEGGCQHTQKDSTKIESSLEMLGTARARLGFLIRDNVLLYGTGGLAWGKFDTEVTAKSEHTDVFGEEFTFSETTSAKLSGDSNHIGWTIGAGAEMMLAGGWSLKGEYLYVDLGDDDAFVSGTAKYTNSFGDEGSTKVGIPGNADHQLHIGRVGLNYNF